jgi:hypothetical protein
MHGRSAGRLDSRIPAEHPLKSPIERAVIDGLAAAEGWTCQILTSRMVTVWLVEFSCVVDGHKESFFVRPTEFDDEDFRLLVAASLRRH